MAVQSKFIRLITIHVSLLMVIYSPNIIKGFGVPGTVLGSRVSKHKAGTEERLTHGQLQGDVRRVCLGLLKPRGERDSLRPEGARKGS